MKTILKTLLWGAVGAAVVMLFMPDTFAVKHQVGSGGDLWTYEEEGIATDDFTTEPVFIGASRTVWMTLDFTTFDAATCTCVIVSDTSDDGTGYLTGVSYAGWFAAGEKSKAVTDLSHTYLWATCDMTSTIGTIGYSVRTTGKP